MNTGGFASLWVLDGLILLVWDVVFCLSCIFKFCIIFWFLFNWLLSNITHFFKLGDTIVSKQVISKRDFIRSNFAISKIQNIFDFISSFHRHIVEIIAKHIYRISQQLFANAGLNFFLFRNISAICTKGIIPVVKDFCITCKVRFSEWACLLMASNISFLTRETFNKLQFSSLSYFFSKSTMLSWLLLIEIATFTVFPSASFTFGPVFHLHLSVGYSSHCYQLLSE